MAHTDIGQTASSTQHPRDRHADPQLPAGEFFEIRVRGYLNDKWSDWLEGMEVCSLDNGEMVLCGRIADQAALMGILNKLNRLNLTLISVNQAAPCARPAGAVGRDERDEH